MQTVNANPNVKVTGRHLAITDAINEYATRKIEGLHLDYPKIIEAHVILGVEKDRHTAEVLLKTKLLDFTGTGQTKDMYSAVLMAIEKLERQALNEFTGGSPTQSRLYGSIGLRVAF